MKFAVFAVVWFNVCDVTCFKVNVQTKIVLMMVWLLCFVKCFYISVCLFVFLH
jgi:hypothetical protein